MCVGHTLSTWEILRLLFVLVFNLRHELPKFLRFLEIAVITKLLSRLDDIHSISFFIVNDSRY